MNNLKQKTIIISVSALIVLIIIGVAVYAFTGKAATGTDVSGNEAAATQSSVVSDNDVRNTLTSPVSETAEESGTRETSDTSDEGNNEAEAEDQSTEFTWKDESGTPVENHGELSVKGTQLVDKNGEAYQLRGVSTHGLAWFPEYVNEDSFRTLRDEWGVNLVRLAMYTDESMGYCSDGNREDIKNLVNNGVSYATDLGMYVIIDWHILHDNNPNIHKSDAIDFFDEMSRKYADYDNVLYEICNEPNSGTSWSDVKSYALEVIPVIKANNPDAIIIVGTPNWSQDVDEAANDPITGYSNIMYTIHFYAETHRDSLRQKMQTALSKNLPIFCTEFGICDASGNGAINKDEANKWMDALNSAGISYCIWNLSNKAESSSLIQNGCMKLYGWSEADLTEEGKWYVGILGGDASGTTVTQTSGNNDNNGNGGNNNNGNTNSGNNNSNSSATQQASASNGNLKVNIAQTGGWNDGTSDFIQYTATLSADGGRVSNWQLNVNFGCSISIDQSWSGNYSIEGNSVIITPVEYNSTINSGESCEVGFIVKVSGNPGTPSVVIN